MAKNNKTRFFCVLYSDKTWVFDQSGRAYDPICILNEDSGLKISHPEYLNKSQRIVCLRGT